MFKVDWKKTSVAYQLPEGMVEKMVRLAYPNEKGFTYNYEATIPGNSYPLDDDLVLCFTKKLR